MIFSLDVRRAQLERAVRRSDAQGQASGTQQRAARQIEATQTLPAVTQYVATRQISEGTYPRWPCW